MYLSFHSIPAYISCPLLIQIFHAASKPAKADTAHTHSAKIFVVNGVPAQAPALLNSASYSVVPKVSSAASSQSTDFDTTAYTVVSPVPVRTDNVPDAKPKDSLTDPYTIVPTVKLSHTKVQPNLKPYTVVTSAPRPTVSFAAPAAATTTTSGKVSSPQQFFPASNTLSRPTQDYVSASFMDDLKGKDIFFFCCWNFLSGFHS